MAQPSSLNGRKRDDILNDYEGFVEKFRPKKTTDDCYTPAPVYDALLGWISDNIMPLDGVEIVRPFWPGGDFESFDYPEGCVVIDNPPFSILAKIIRFFDRRGIRYFLFAPALTMGNSAKEVDDTHIVTNAVVTYENGAKVPTAFRTNLPCDGTGVWVSGSLSKVINEASEAHRRNGAKELPKYVYPRHVASPAILRNIAQPGVELRIPKGEFHRISRIDAAPKGIYGGGWLLSDRAAAERAAAERAAAREVHYFALSEAELAIVAQLNQNTVR